MCQYKTHKRLLRFAPWVKKILWSRKWQPTPVFLSRKFHGQRSLVGYSLWDHKESDTTKHEDNLSNTVHQKLYFN